MCDSCAGVGGGPALVLAGGGDPARSAELGAGFGLAGAEESLAVDPPPGDAELAEACGFVDDVHAVRASAAVSTGARTRNPVDFTCPVCRAEMRR
jgi:hypothetical protein